MWSLCREVGSLVLVAALVFVLLRLHVADRYQVLTPSMEPCLHGAANGTGDVLLVDKRVDSASLKRFDIVVVRNRIDPTSPHHLIKRIAAIGPGTVSFRSGDLFVRDAGQARPRRVQKDPFEHRELLRRSFLVAPAAGGGDHPRRHLRANAAWRTPRDSHDILLAAVPEAELAAWRESASGGTNPLEGHLSLAAPLDGSFPIAGSASDRGALGGGSESGSTTTSGKGETWPVDVGHELTVEFGPGVAAVQLIHQELDRWHVVQIDAAGNGHCWRLENSIDGTPRRRESGPEFRAGAGSADSARRLLFARLDGRFVIGIDGKTVAEWPAMDIAESARLRVGQRFRPFERCLLHVAAVADPALDSAGPQPAAELRIFRYETFHDAFLPSEDHGYELESGELFLLGDNVGRSADSRDLYDRHRPAFRVEDVIGRAELRLAPWSRYGSLR